ncbi:unnamed protein product [Blepharisma stoltei]|uniref:Uncharacterized protein n=1 Tax=Blepharisma stoltei TaxID=1481888 RepID=A0AAU9JLN5_9CILI|nr:unnamed protein product [Blepharisma stoltei]
MSRRRGYTDTIIPTSPKYSPLYTSSALLIPDATPQSTSSFNIPHSLSTYNKKSDYKSPNSSLNTSLTGSPVIQSDYLETTTSGKDFSFTSKIILDLKLEIKQKEYHINELEKLVEQMTITLDEFENKIELLAQENEKLKGKYKNRQTNDIVKLTEKWEKELIKRNEEIRNLEKVFEEKEKKSKIMMSIELENLKKIIKEKNRRMKELELQLIRKDDTIRNRSSGTINKVQSLQEAGSEGNFKNFRRSVIIDLDQNEIKKEEERLFTQKIQELEKLNEILSAENSKLIEENEMLMKQGDGGNLLYFSSDVRKIKRDVSQTLNVLKELKEGKQVNLKVILMGEENIYSKSSAHQISRDLIGIKHDLDSIRSIIADIYSDHTEGNICVTQ